MSFDSLYNAFGDGNTKSKSRLKAIYANPAKYTRDEISSAYRDALSRPSRSDEQFFKNVGSDDDDYVFQPERYQAASNRYNTALNSLLIKGLTAPAPAAPKSASAAAPAPAPVATDNTYRKESEALLKKISDMETQLQKVQRPKTIFAAPSAVSAGNLQIAPAAGVNRAGGTSSFKRRTTSPSTSKVRTIQSLNI